METRTYADLFTLIEALCGVSFADIEKPRINALINRRATRAFRSSKYWPRFLYVSEERVVTDNVLPYEESPLAKIDKFIMINRTAAFLSSSSQMYGFNLTAVGATLVAGSSAPESAWVTYQAVHDAVYGDGTGETTDVPKEWFDYLAHGSYSDYLRSEGQQDKSLIADQEATDILVEELMLIDESTQLITTRIATNANMQTRSYGYVT